MKKLLSIIISMTFIFSFAVNCFAVDQSISNSEETICLTPGYDEKEKELTDMLTRMAEINLELKNQEQHVNVEGLSTIESSQQNLLDEYYVLETALDKYRISLEDFKDTLFSSLSKKPNRGTNDYDLGDVTSAFDMLTGMYNIVTLSGSWARGGVVYDTFCVMVSDKVGGTYLDTFPQNVTLYKKKSQTNTLANLLDWVFNFTSDLVTMNVPWYVDSIFGFLNLNGGFDISDVNHTYQLTIAGTSVMRYTYVKPQSGNTWIHANTSHKVIATETHLLHYKVFPSGGQSYYDSSMKTERRYLDGRYYMSDIDAIDNYRSYPNPSALFVTQNSIEATYTGKDGSVRISYTYFDYPFQLH